LANAVKGTQKVKFTHVTLRIKPEMAERYESAFRKVRAQVLQNEPGCPLFELCRDPNEPYTYHILEAYADAEAIKAHTDAEYYKETIEFFVQCIEGEHMKEIQKRGLSGRAMLSLVKNIEFERFESL
jgi:quinol monooxygenase YgiN